MRAVIQRVSHCAVTADGHPAGKIGRGLLILLGVGEDDGEEQVAYLAEKCVGLRIFTDENDKMNQSVVDIAGSVLVVSNFTLYGDCRKGKRPNFMAAGRPELAQQLYEQFVRRCRERGVPVETGEFGAHMEIDMRADGPVTIYMDTQEMRKGRIT